MSKIEFKIEFNAVDIVNYIKIAKHLEEMASKGWLLDRIKFSGIFIYKKIEPSELNFSITPLILKDEKWKHCTEVSSFNIYYSEELDIDRKINNEELEKILNIGRKDILGYKIFVVIALLMTEFIIYNRFFYGYGVY